MGINKIWRAAVVVSAAALATGTAVVAASANTPPASSACYVTNISYTVNGVAAPLSSATKGSHVVVNFTVPAGCSDQLTFAAYRTPTAMPNNNYEQQILDNYQSNTFTGGSYSLAVDVPGAPAGNASQCSVQHNNSNGKGANQSPGPYDPTCDGSASQNGKSTNNNSSKPCAGCVGNADGKNPPGQYPNGNDHNAGYECDRNQGVGQTNPAHTGCQNYQVDFVYGPVIQQLGGPNDAYYGTGKIAWVLG